MTKIGAQKIGTQARVVMAAIEAGRPLTRMGDAWRAGTLVATAAVVAELKRHDLVREAGDRLVASRAGTGFGTREATPEGANRLLAEHAPARGRRVTVNLAESPLGWLKARGLLSERQFVAGERLRADWTAANLAPSVTMRWDAMPSARGAGGAIDPTTGQIAAKRRFEAAVAALGSGLADVAWRVICAGEGLELAETALGWPRRSGKLVLLMALDRLADHYRLSK